MEEPIIVDGDDGPEVVGYKLKKNPACDIGFKARAEVRRFAERFGFDPLALQRIKGTANVELTAQERLEEKLRLPPPPLKKMPVVN